MSNLRSRTGAFAVVVLLVASPFDPPLISNQSKDERLAQGAAIAARGEQAQTARVVEIRSYNLKAGTRDRFHQRFVREALPMLQRRKIDVVAYGPSLHDADSYYLMRAYASVEERQRSEDAFYGSDEWKQGPREAVLADIVSYATIVVRLDDAAVRGLRKLVDGKAVEHGR